MIFANARDGGTRPLIARGYVPGEDRLTYVEADFEYDVFTMWLRSLMNKAMQECDPPLDVAPWPDELPAQAPLDMTQRYQGLQFTLNQYDQTRDVWNALVPGGIARYDETPERDDRDHENMSRCRNPQEMQDDPSLDRTKWIRLPFVNEQFATVMKEEAWWRWEGLQNGLFTVTLPDNDYFEPFDLTHPERYRVVDDDGIPAENPDDFLYFADGARMTFILRPRRWRWIVTVIAHYCYYSGFEEVPNDEVFLTAYFQRPPFYPSRQELVITALPESYWAMNYYGEPRSVDNGLSDSWRLTWHQEQIRQQIMSQQWFSLCIVYVYESAEDPDCAIVAYPPAVDDIVLGIVRTDNVTGRESRVWVMQKADVSDVYPQRTIGQFILTNWQP